MPTAFDLIAKQVLSSNAADISFINIPATYDDLVIAMSARRSASTGAGRFKLTFNGSGTGYNFTSLESSGSAASSSTTTYIGGELGLSTYTANTFNSANIYIPNYAGSTNKIVSVSSVTENNAATAYMILGAGLWSNTSAITSIKLEPAGDGDFVTNSSFCLYGVTKA